MARSRDALALAIFSLIHGFRRRRELFVIYAYIYGLIAVDILVIDFLHDQIVVTSYLLVSTVAAIVALFVTHMRFRRVEA